MLHVYDDFTSTAWIQQLLNLDELFLDFKIFGDLILSEQKLLNLNFFFMI